MSIINNLFILLDKRNLSAKELSSATNISNGNISDWKNGRSLPTAPKLLILANYLDCSIDYLLGRTDTPEIVKADISPAVVNSKKENELLKMFRELDYEAQGDIFDIVKLKYEKHLKKTKERLSRSDESTNIA